MKNTILLLTDFSACARNASVYALASFPPEEYDYILLHVNPRIQAPGEIRTSISEVMREDAYKSLDQEESALRQLTGLTFEMKKIAYLGFLNEAVNAMAEAHHPDLVVMGTQGETGLPAIFIGSHATSLIKSISLPLLIIPEQARFDGLQDIVIAADMETLYKPEHLEPLAELADIFESTITILNVQKSKEDHPTDDDHTLSVFYETLGDRPTSVVHLVDDRPDRAIAQFVHDQPCDLLVMIERSRTFVVDLFHRSVTKNLALHTETPLLILHD